MIAYIEDIKKDGDTVGGIIRCHIDHAQYDSPPSW
jgi:chorismate synthase